MKEIQFLKGERVYLRPFTEEDTDFFDVWYNDALTRLHSLYNVCSAADMTVYGWRSLPVRNMK